VEENDSSTDVISASGASSVSINDTRQVRHWSRRCSVRHAVSLAVLPLSRTQVPVSLPVPLPVCLLVTVRLRLLLGATRTASDVTVHFH